MESNDQYLSSTHDVTLKELFEGIYRQRLLILLTTFGFALVAGLIAWMLPKTYEATVVISPVTDSGGSQLGGLSSLASQFGGLASLAGISLSGDSKKSEALAILQSEALTEQYIHTHNLLPILFSSQWDTDKNTWVDSTPEKKPTLWKGNEYFKGKIRKIKSDTKTGTVALTIAWREPKLAAKWANDLVEMTNDYLRNKALHESERNIIYLKDEATKTDVVAIREAIYSILKTEINKAMLARGTNEYAFKILDPAVPPELPSSPKPSLWIVIAGTGGFLLSLLTVFAQMAWRKSSMS